MIFLNHKHPRTVADLIARDIERATVVAGEHPDGIPLRWKAPSSLAIVSADEDLAKKLSTLLRTMTVFAMSYPGTFSGELAVYDAGTLIRRIVCSDDGDGDDGIGGPSMGAPFPFEAEVFDLDDDDDDDADRSLSESTVCEFCKHLDIVTEPFVQAQWTVLVSTTDSVPPESPPRKRARTNKLATKKNATRRRR